MPDQYPEVGQLQADVHATDDGVIEQLTDVKLFKTTIVPPDIVREFRALPVTVIGEDVEVETSSKVTPFGVTKVRRMPEFANVNVVAPVRVRVWPVVEALTEKVAPRRQPNRLKILKLQLFGCKNLLTGTIQNICTAELIL